MLVVDDHSSVCTALEWLFGGEGFEVTKCQSPEEALRHVQNTEYTVAVIDMNYSHDTTSGREGLELLDGMRFIDPELPVIVMTGWTSNAGRTQAIQKGAKDYIVKPWDDDDFVSAVERWRRRPQEH